MIWFGLFLFACLGGWLSRMCGGAPPNLPWRLAAWLYALPYLIVSVPTTIVIAALFTPYYLRQHWRFLVLLPYFGALVGKRTGHGGGIDLGTNMKERDLEKLEYLIAPLRGRMPEYWYDVLLLSITGLAATLIAGVLISFIWPLNGVLIIVSGLLKGPAYMIGWAIYPNGSGKGISQLNEATQIGEFLTGFIAWGAIGLAIMKGFGL